MTLNTLPNIKDPDLIYERLIKSHEGRSNEASAALNAKLVLLLINQIGDTETILAAIDAAVEAQRDWSSVDQIGFKQNNC